MARYVATASTPWSVDDTFAYLADLRHFAAWDPGVSDARLVSGDPGTVGATFDVDVRNAGRTMTLRYETLESEPPRRVLVRAETNRLRSIDEITVEPAAGGATVVYDARLELEGVLGLLDPLLGLAFRRIGGRAAAGLRDRLGAEPEPGRSPG